MTGCKRITYIDIAKIFAMFLVVYTHTAQNIAQDNYMNEIGFTSIQSLHMPLFMIMSGYFLNLDKLKKNIIADYLKKKFLHLVLPTFFCNIVDFILIICYYNKKRRFFYEKSFIRFIIIVYGSWCVWRTFLNGVCQRHN